MSAFDDALRDLAGRAERAHRDTAGLPAAQMARRARRNRRARGAGVATVSLTAVLAVVLGGAALGSRPEPAPPAVSESPSPVPISPTPSPSPAPTPSAVGPTATPAPVAGLLPPGDPSLPFGECGSVVGADPADPVTDVLLVDLSVRSTTVAAGTPLAVETRVDTNYAAANEADPWNARGLNVSALPAAGPRLLVVRAGVVVAVDDAYHGARTDHFSFSVDGMTVITHVLEVGLVACEPGSAVLGVQPGSVPLPAGDYEAYAVLPLAGDDQFGQGDPEELAASSPFRGTVLSGPAPFAVVGSAEAVRPPADGPVGLEAWPTEQEGPTECGGPAPDVTPDSPVLFASFAGLPRTAAVGDPWDLTASLTYRGPGRLTFSTLTSPTALLVRDGVVVGSIFPPNDNDWAEADLGSGHTLGFSTSREPYTCLPGTFIGDGGDRLPPGTYEVYPEVGIGVKSVWVDGVLETRDGLTIVGPPSTVVVE